MYFAIISTDKPDSLQLRMDTRPANREHLQSLGDALKLGGPMLTDEGSQMNGGLLIVEAESIDAARKIAERDPYFKAGLFANVDVRAWDWLRGNPDAS